jgi:two-component system sensor histidine kinase BaeS
VGRKIFWGSLAVGLVMLLVGAVTLVLLRASIRTSAYEELVRQADVTAAIVEEELSEVPFRPGGDIRRQVDGFRGNVDRVLDRAGVVAGYDLAEAALETPRGVVPLSRDHELLAALPIDAIGGEVVSVEVAGTEVLATVRRIDLDIGALVVAVGRETPLLPLRTVSRALLVVVGIGSILMIAFGTWFARSASRRLAALEAAAGAIAGGDLTTRASIDGNDEITEVSRAFNNMAAQLQAGRIREREFLMNVSHDLRTPLTTIRGYAEALDAGQIEEEDMVRVVGVLHAETNRLSRLVEDVMLLARLEAREFTLRPESVDLGAHMREVVDAYRDRAVAAGVTLDVVDEGVGQVRVDPDRIAQVGANLIDNALRFTAEGGTVTVSLRSSGESVVLTVTDSGPGIDPEDLPSVFDRLFATNQRVAVRPEGSGLGLAIVRELVEVMGGSVGASSPAEGGTRFTVLIDR